MEIINPHRFAPPAVDFDGFGNASRYFDGVSDYIDLGDVLDSVFVGTGKKFTVTAWVKTNAVNGAIICKDNYSQSLRQWNFQIVDSGKIRVVASNPNGTIQRRFDSVSTYATNNNWTHVAFTYDQTQADDDIVTLYANGSEVSHTITNNNGTGVQISDTVTPLAIGAFIQPSVTFPFEGHIADVRIYDADLSSTDITALYGGENITTNLVGHWLKDTPSLLDHSGTNDGTNNGSAFAYDNPSPAVEFGKASRFFDGVDDEVIIPDSPSFPTGAQTWSCWVKPSRLNFGASGQDMMSRWGSQGLNELSALLFLANTGIGKPQFYISDNGSNFFLVASSDSLTVNTWHHVVGVFTPNTSMKIYVDGVLKGTNTTSIPAAIKDTPSDFVIGWRDFTFDAHFKGNICDCRIYDTDLTATDISDLYNGTNITTNLVGHWLTNTDDVKDYAGVNDGTNIGSTYSFDNPLGNGEFGSASRSFDGVNDYIDLPSSASSYNFIHNTKVFSFGAWIKVTPNTNTLQIISVSTSGSTQTGIFFAFDDRNGVHDNAARFFISHGSAGFADQLNIQNAILDTDWHHVLFTGDGVTIRCYIDGQIQATTEPVTYTGSYGNASNDLRFGKHLIATPYYLTGNIADVRIYDTALTSTDIAALYGGKNITTNLVGHWLTNKDDVDDYAGTNHGTNNGSTYSQDAPL